MKTIITHLSILFSILLFMPGNVLAQHQEQFSYQSVIRNANGELLRNELVSIRFRIRENTPFGSIVFEEFHSDSTNQNGLLSLTVGAGTPGSGQLSSLNWSQNNYYIEVGVDFNAGNNYSLLSTTPLLAVPMAIHAKTADSLTQPLSETDPIFSNSLAASISPADTANWNSKLDSYTETDPVFSNSLAASISPADTANWNNKLDSFTESDPMFSNSLAASISPADTANWNSKLDSYTETDPIFSNSLAASISSADTANWNSKLDSYTETDPVFSNSLAASISPADTTSWNNKLDSYTETDPIFSNSLAASISPADTTNWNNKLDSYTETDPIFSNSLAASISPADTASWNNKLDSYTETDPVFSNSLAASISPADTTNWNSKLDSETQSLSDVLNEGNSANNQRIADVSTPIDPNDVANKAYVDALEAKVSALENFLIDAGLYSVTDIEGNEYSVVKIGTQVWMGENLKTSVYNDGVAIANLTTNSAWNSATGGAWSWFNNDSATYHEAYGKLYNFSAATSGRLCPQGWHVPSRAEWDTLAIILGGDSIAGGKLKQTGTTVWNSPNVGATNETNFTALPAGFRDQNGSFGGFGDAANFWSATPTGSPLFAFFAYTNALSEDLYVAFNGRGFGFSIRCLRD